MDIEKVRKKRENAVSIYTKFIKNRDLFNKKLFCFFEGEDRKYYVIRIEKYSNILEDNIISYSCNGKEQVLKLYKMLQDKYNDVKKMFFVDKDFDEIKTQKELYVTPCYSIENHYVTNKAFEKILHNEFGINKEEDDFKKCLRDFNKRKEEFNSEIKKLNAWIYYQKLKMEELGIVNISYQNFKLRKVFEIKIDKLNIKNEITIKLLKEEYKEAYDINESELNKYINLFKDETFFRGKYQLEFLKMILDDMINKNKKGEYFEYFRDNVKINPNINTLSSLSVYADTPDSLKIFFFFYIL